MNLLNIAKLPDYISATLYLDCVCPSLLVYLLEVTFVVIFLGSCLHTAFSCYCGVMPDRRVNLLIVYFFGFTRCL